MKGKSKCKVLKEIRRQIAANNDITFVTTECRFQGDCTGTCPKCEAEVRYLEEELLKRQRSGKAVVLAGLTATLTLSALGCVPNPNQVNGDIAMPETSQTLLPPGGVPDPSYEDLMGEPVYTEPTTTPFENELMGVPVYPDPSTTPTEEIIMGDIPLVYPGDEDAATDDIEPVMGEPAPGNDFP